MLSPRHAPQFAGEASAVRMAQAGLQRIFPYASRVHRSHCPRAGGLMFEHPSWRQRPLQTAYRLLTCKLRQRIPALHEATIAYDDGRARMVVDVGTAFGYTMYRYGHSDPDTDLSLALLSPGDLCIDGGAHVGLVALV